MASSAVWGQLNPPRNETRVVSLESTADFDAEIRCTLTTVSLDDNPSYSALSYACGDPLDKVTITVEDATVSVPRNLTAALRYIRMPGLTETFWIDAVSIDQTKSDERAQQIRLMSRIYRQARQVCVWLGEPTEHSELGMGLLGAFKGPGTPLTWAEANVNTEERALECALGLQDILTRRWWSRLWTAQELVLAQQAGFMCGRVGFNAQNLSSVHEIGILLTYLFRQGLPGVRRQILMREACDKVQNVHTLRDLFYRQLPSAPPAAQAEIFRIILDLCRNRKATEALDMVFGLIGLCPEFVSSPLNISYNISRVVLYQNMTFQLMHHTLTLNILRDAGLSCDPPSEWPSWFPDWSAPKPYSALSVEDHNYRACADHIGNFGVQNCTLFAKGIFIDTIPASGLGECRNVRAGWEDADMSAMAPFLRSWAKMCEVPASPREVCGPYLAGGTASEAFYRTLCADIKCIAQQDGFITRRLTEEDIEKDLDIADWADLDLQGVPQEPLDDLTATRDVVPMLGTNRIFRTETGYFGNGTKYVESGDEIFVVQGSKFPLVLRPVEGVQEMKTFKLVEVCYVQGVMYGEAFRHERLEDIRII